MGRVPSYGRRFTNWNYMLITLCCDIVPYTCMQRYMEKWRLLFPSSSFLNIGIPNYSKVECCTKLRLGM